MPRALITGGSTGLGRALAHGLVDDGWDVVLTARRADRLAETVEAIGPAATGVVGDVTDPDHRGRLAVRLDAGLDLLVLNAGALGPSPLRPLVDVDEEQLRVVWETNVLAPFALVRDLRDVMVPGAAFVAITSDAAVDHYPTWGPYGASKAALEHLVATFAVELPEHRWWSFDPGDLRTEMHQAAFPGEDISDRPLPESVVPAFRRLLTTRPPSGRVRAAALQPTAVAS